jgi:hypothetical protein
MLTANLSLDDATGDEIAFNLQSYLPDGARRVDVTTTPTEPRTLTIQHTQSGKGAAIVDRHLVSASLTKDNADSGGPKRAIVNLTISLPRTTAFANADVYDLIAVIVDLIADGGFSGSGLAGTTNVAAILRGES